MAMKLTLPGNKLVTKKLSLVGMSVLTVVLSGCSAIPSSIVNANNSDFQPQVNYPKPGPKQGAIYSAGQYRSMFEGRRASNIGDTLTVVITENTSADKNEAGNVSKKGSLAVASMDINGTKTQPTLATNSTYSNQDSGDANNKNTFTGQISVTVLDVKPNGNLLVSGEKQVAFDQGVEFIRMSGIVNPYMITNENTVLSSTIADARIEYRTNSTFDLANLMKRLNRFFLSTSPI